MEKPKCVDACMPNTDNEFFVKKTIDGKETRCVTDPRPDLGDGLESLNWADLLMTAWQINRRMAYALHGFRCCGTRLVKNEKGSWVLRPEISPRGWESKEDYDKFKEKYLEPNRRDVILALKKIP